MTDFEEAIDVKLEDIPPGGLRVRLRRGECFGDEIEWAPAEDAVLVVDEKCNPDGERGLNVVHLSGSTCGWGFAGYEVATKTWWRYQAEAKSGAYREHCMRVLARM